MWDALFANVRERDREKEKEKEKERERERIEAIVMINIMRSW